MGGRAPQRPSIEAQMDKYLDFYGRSSDTVEHVVAVLTKYDHLVSLAAERALEDLWVPDNVIPFPRYKVLPTDAS